MLRDLCFIAVSQETRDFGNKLMNSLDKFPSSSSISKNQAITDPFSVEVSSTPVFVILADGIYPRKIVESPSDQSSGPDRTHPYRLYKHPLQLLHERAGCCGDPERGGKRSCSLRPPISSSRASGRTVTGGVLVRRESLCTQGIPGNKGRRPSNGAALARRRTDVRYLRPF